MYQTTKVAQWELIEFVTMKASQRRASMLRWKRDDGSRALSWKNWAKRPDPQSLLRDLESYPQMRTGVRRWWLLFVMFWGGENYWMDVVFHFEIIPLILWIDWFSFELVLFSVSDPWHFIQCGSVSHSWSQQMGVLNEGFVNPAPASAVALPIVTGASDDHFTSWNHVEFWGREIRKWEATDSLRLFVTFRPCMVTSHDLK
jgi:hypothetical protein